MFNVTYGGKAGKTYTLLESDGDIAVRTQPARATRALRGDLSMGAPLSPAAREVLEAFDPIAEFPESGVEVLRPRSTRGARGMRDEARRILKREPSLRFAGRALCDPKSKTPVVYTENAFVKFADDVKAAQIKQILKKHKFTARRAVSYARNAWLISAPDDCGLDLFGLVERLFREDAVELLHPELVRRAVRKGAFAQQWHLKKTTVNGKSVDAHANVEAAWPLADGAGITIAIIDDGVDIDHEEFRSSGKIIAPRDVTLGTDNPRPGFGNRHGTCCAGVACADGAFGASGVAPKSRLLPIRLASGLGSSQEAEAFAHAARNGADVISCSWGPEDGKWWDASDPTHQLVVPLPDSTRLAIDFAVTQGRNGKGCVVLFAAGNGNEPVGNDGYASYEKVIAVAASNDTGKKAAYSDTGSAVWCAFPSGDTVEPMLTPGIWTTDNTGPSGYNPGDVQKGDKDGKYNNGFGGTSSACPGAAGVAALALSRNPALRWDEVREILKNCADKIDTIGGAYDASGHSDKYGYGRLNARKAVELAAAGAAPSDRVVSTSAKKNVAIRDFKTSKLALTIAEAALVKSLRVDVDIEHTYIGDLNVQLHPPAASKLKAIVLHNSAGGGTDNLRKRYDALNTPALATLAGKSAAGEWTLVVKDTARGDTGTIKSLTIELTV
jgi:subtilisin family serine protease